MAFCEACGCGTHRAEELERAIGKPAEQQLWRCGDCGHVQVHPIPGPEHLAGYYQRLAAGATRPKRVRWAGGRTRVAPSYLRRLERGPGGARDGAGNAAKLLDVGFGSGSFLRAAHRLGYSVTGVDTAVQRFQPDFECEVREGPMVPGTFPDDSFEVITAHHVLEHVDDLALIMDAMHAALRSGGHLLVEVPNDLHSLAKALKRLLLRRRFTKFTRLQHLRYFTVTSLGALLEGAGFQVAVCRQIPVYEMARFPESAFLIPLAPLERLSGRGHCLEATAVKR